MEFELTLHAERQGSRVLTRAASRDVKLPHERTFSLNWEMQDLLRKKEALTDCTCISDRSAAL